MSDTFTYVFSGASEVATLDTGAPIPRRGKAQADVALRHGVAVAVAGERIAAIGEEATLRADPRWVAETERIDVGGRLIAPGLIDAHTHFIFAGSRADEFEEKIRGVPYLEIARRGGGIRRTVRETRAASSELLLALGRRRLDRYLGLGVTTVEVKSGYGLSREHELRMLRVAAQLDQEHPVDVVRTLLAAHEVPDEISKDDYLSLILERIIPDAAAQGLAEFCDVFREEGVYSPEETERIVAAARAHGLRPRLHVDQIHALGGAELAARLAAASADHLDRITEEGIRALARSDTVAMLLPGCSFFMGLETDAPARRMIEAGVAVGLATDFNPGSCMTQNLLLIMTMGCTRLRMTAAEVLTAVTVNAAHSLGRGEELGRIAVGLPADLAVFDVPTLRDLVYHFGEEHAWLTMKRGKIVWRRSPGSSGNGGSRADCVQ